MLDLELFATLFRAINWASVQRLILVGDPNQLPPIGRGRVFADILDWLQEYAPENVGLLKINIRQMDNRLNDKGNGILDLASLYTRTDQATEKDGDAKTFAENMFRKMQEGGDIDKDLRIVFWKNPDDLAEKLIEIIIKDLENDTGLVFNKDRTFDLWDAAFNDNGKRRPEYQQVISPYRGDLIGTDHLNILIQKLVNGERLERIGNLGGLTLYDKIIQIINRPRSNPVEAYSTITGRKEKIEVYNGEIGFVEPDQLSWNNGGNKHKLRSFQVVFSRKPDYRINVHNRDFVEENLDLAYAISVHKAQGSEFDRVYFVLPKNKKTLLSRELFYTGITRARCHCTILIEEDISPLLSMYRPENSHLISINSSLFSFRPIPEELLNRRGWYEEGKIHSSLADFMVRSKSEVIIANMLFDRNIPFKYEVLLYAPDGTFFLPDFTLIWAGETFYWEHLGRLDLEKYRADWNRKKEWYARFFPGHLVTTHESGDLSKDANEIIKNFFS